MGGAVMAVRQFHPVDKYVQGFTWRLVMTKNANRHAIWMKRHRMDGKHTDGLCEADCRSGQEQRNERIYNT